LTVGDAIISARTTIVAILMFFLRKIR
jgi:hypothetical protein